MSTLYNRYQDEINADGKDILGEPVDNEEVGSTEEDDEEILEDDEREEFRPKWMYLAEMGPNVIIEDKSDLGSRDMDQNYDWINGVRQRYSNNELMEADSFVNRGISNEGKNEQEIDYENDVDYQTLNEKQKIVFNLRYYDEMPYEEMSRVLETSEGALKASYHHAVKKIEDYMLNH